MTPKYSGTDNFLWAYLTLFVYPSKFNVIYRTVKAITSIDNARTKFPTHCVQDLFIHAH